MGFAPSSGAQLSPSPACPGCWGALSAHQAHCSLPPSWGVFGAQGCFCSALSASPGGCEQPPHATLTPAPLLPHHEAPSTSRGFFIWSRASLPSTAVVGGGFDRVPKLLPARSQAGLFATSKGGGICTITRLVMSSTQGCSTTGPRAVGSQRAPPPQQGTSWDAP